MPNEKPEDYPALDKGTKKVDYGYNPVPKEEVKPPVNPPPPPTSKPTTEEKTSN